MNLLELLEELEIPVYRTDGDWITINCPFCGVSGKPGMGIAKESLACNCWKCGINRLADVLSVASGKPLHDILDHIQEIYQHKLSTEPHKPSGKLILPRGTGELLPTHLRYLKGRGFNPDELVKLWGIQGIGLVAHLKWRIFIPVIHQGRMVSWTTRSVGNHAQRYISASVDQEAVPRSSLLFGEDYCRHTVVVTEGCFDAMRIGPGAVATMGISYTRSQVERVSRYPIRVVVFDNEYDAQRRADQLCDELQSFPGKTERIILDSKDPASASDKEIQIIRKMYLRNR